MGLLSWLIKGIEDAMTNRADVISMSIGTTVDLTTGEGAGTKAAFDQITYAAAQAGIVLIASAGNDDYDLSNPRYIELPAQARGVLAVVASTNSACAENLTVNVTCAPGPVTLPYYSNYGAPLNALAAPGGSYPAGGDLAVSGWIRGACSSGKPSTTDGLPTDAAHSYGCFNLGHTAYVQAVGTSASSTASPPESPAPAPPVPPGDAAAMVAAQRSSAIRRPLTCAQPPRSGAATRAGPSVEIDGRITSSGQTPDILLHTLHPVPLRFLRQRFSISSAFLITSADIMFLFVLSTCSFNSVASESSLCRVKASSFFFAAHHHSSLISACLPQILDGSSVVGPNC